jgi:hypothetical protein
MGAADDSLDAVELVMAIEEAICDLDLAPDARERLIREIEARIESGEFPDADDFDDDALGALVRNLGPRNPRGPLGHAGAAVKPEEPFFE